MLFVRGAHVSLGIGRQGVPPRLRRRVEEAHPPRPTVVSIRRVSHGLHAPWDVLSIAALAGLRRHHGWAGFHRELCRCSTRIVQSTGVSGVSLLVLEERSCCRRRTSDLDDGACSEWRSWLWASIARSAFLSTELTWLPLASVLHCPAPLFRSSPLVIIWVARSGFPAGASPLRASRTPLQLDHALVVHLFSCSDSLANAFGPSAPCVDDASTRERSPKHSGKDRQSSILSGGRWPLWARLAHIAPPLINNPRRANPCCALQAGRDLRTEAGCSRHDQHDRQ